MKILNLAYPDQSEIKFRIDRYPDGQQQVVINHRVSDIQHWSDTSPLYKLGGIQIKARLNNFLDLELIICATKSLRNLGVREIHLYTPWFMGARSDRQFEEGSNRYLADVICPIINSLNFESVTVLDAHSYVLENCLNNFKNITNEGLVKWAVAKMFPHKEMPQGYFKEMPQGYFDRNHFEQNTILVSPDAGASHKIYKLAEQIGYTGEIITCSKERNKEGKVVKTIVTDDNGSLGDGKDIIIIDDICDGGATFFNIAKEIKPQIATQCKIYLIVTHGIFSKGFAELAKYFDGIYCTNSYSTLPKWQESFGKIITDEFIKQLNVLY